MEAFFLFIDEDMRAWAEQQATPPTSEDLYRHLAKIAEEGLKSLQADTADPEQ